MSCCADRLLRSQALALHLDSESESAWRQSLLQNQSVCVKLEPLNSHFSRWWDSSPVTTALSECRDVQQMLQKPDLKSAWSDQGSKRMFTQGTEIRSADSTIMDFYWPFGIET